MKTLQLAMFDKHASLKAKCRGMTEAEQHAREFLDYARGVARELAEIGRAHV